MTPVRHHVRSLTALLLVLFALLLPTSAQASYSAPVGTACAGYYNQGGRDASGKLYMACGTKIHIVPANGGAAYTVPSDTSVERVAPSPDGTYLYSVNGTTAFRLTWSNGAYRRDGFTFQTPAGWAARGWRVCGWGIATDAYGKVYVSNGGWCPGNPNQIVKYRPDGTVMTVFGDYGVATKWYPCGTTNCVEWNNKGSVPGQFQPNMMIAVTADGSRVWIADQNNQRVQVFERSANNLDYQYRTMWSGEGTRFDGQAGAIYGVGVDAWGRGYASLTTARVVYRLDPEARNPVLVADRSNQTSRPHTIAVDHAGNVWVGEWGLRYNRTDPAPGAYPVLPVEPRPDLTAPTLASVTAPAETTAGSVSVTIAANDDIGVTRMRLADENGNWGAWRAFASPVEVPLTAGVGTKVIYVQVGDTAGRESNSKYAIVQRRPVPDMADPTLSISAPAAATTSTIPLTITTSDDVAVTHIRFATEEGTFGDWQPWGSGSSTIQHALTPGYGIRIVAVQVRDAAWKTSPVAQATITVSAPPPPVVTQPTVDGGGGDVPDTVGASVDTVAPRIVSIVVPRRSCSRRIVLRIGARDDRGVKLVRVANENGRFGRWRAYRPRLVHYLSRGTTRKAVYVQVRDARGHISNTVARRTIVVRCR